MLSTTFTNTPASFVPGPQPEPRTLAEIVAIEPRIIPILNDAKRFRSRRRHWRAYEALKGRAAHLVGWFASNRRLRSSDCYDAVISAIVAGGKF